MSSPSFNLGQHFGTIIAVFLGIYLATSHKKRTKEQENSKEDSVQSS
jgi:hypothetical protein